jgi:hypothetical protein
VARAASRRARSDCAGFPDRARTSARLCHAGARSGSIWSALLAVAAVDASREWRSWLAFGPGGVVRLRDVASEVRRLAGPDCTMVTFQTHLAVEAGCRPLPGLEYSQFALFPELPPSVAEARGVLTPELLERRVRELRPELLVAQPRELARLAPGSVLDAYALHGSRRIGSGARLPLFPGSIRVDVYVRRDLPEGGGRP